MTQPPDTLTTTSAVPPETIERFMRDQVVHWNGHDKAAFMALYREIAPLSLEITYAGRSDQADGWLVIEEMYDKHNAQFRLEVVSTIYGGNEAAVHHHNCIVGTDAIIESIETYRFEPGRLWVCYHLKAPAAEQVDLNQFRGFASTDA